MALSSFHFILLMLILTWACFLSLRQKNKYSKKILLSGVSGRERKFSLSSYVDAHAHIIHEKFSINEIPVIHEKCVNMGLEFIICNGLNPSSNRKVLELHNKYKIFAPALGIYPLDAASSIISGTFRHRYEITTSYLFCVFSWEESSWTHPFPPPDVFDVDSEISYIDQMAAEKVAIIFFSLHHYTPSQ